MAWRNGIVTGVVVGLLGVVFSSTSGGAGRAQGNGAIKLNCAQQPCDQVARGRAAFNDGNLKALGGDGRACADCHMPSEHFQLSPAAARARFEALLAKREFNKNADDALFRPVDADDFRMNGENASDFSNLVDNALVRVTLPLPPNVRLLDPVTGQPTNETATDLFRAVMPVMNVAITGPDGVVPIWPPAPRVPIPGVDPNGPNRQGGYQHDARFATLQEQARGALIAHAQVSVEPPSDMLDDLAAFQQTLFSSPGVERLAEAIASGSTPFPDPDPELTEIEQQGKAVFNRACATCHGGSLHPSGSTPCSTTTTRSSGERPGSTRRQTCRRFFRRTVWWSIVGSCRWRNDQRCWPTCESSECRRSRDGRQSEHERWLRESCLFVEGYRWASSGVDSDATMGVPGVLRRASGRRRSG